MPERFIWTVVVVCILCMRAASASACGGFFCGRQPVDQSAERILFKVNPNSVTMIVQIAYTGAADDFAWVLPLGSVPERESLSVFPLAALTALDANTSPQFVAPSSCFDTGGSGGCGTSSEASATGSRATAGSVMVHFRSEVGPYDVAAIESEDPMALYDWLRQAGFNVNASMLPYIRAYTEEGMKFIALKLRSSQATSDIQPLRFDLPGTTPAIPLRMTALAAEPEMGILVFVLADQRYAAANWPAVEIEDDQIAWQNALRNNWRALVARGVDQAGGQGFVTELAEPTTGLSSLLQSSGFASPADMQAGQALLELMKDARYITRLYTRLSPEEMTVDPIFKRHEGGNVSSLHGLSRNVAGVDQCDERRDSPDPCLFTSCGAGGMCRPVQPPGAGFVLAGCACLDGAAARTTNDPNSASMAALSGSAPTSSVACQDMRMSFVNPGDVMEDGQIMPDPCVNFDCGENGQCTALNMTPTCVCDRGFVAVGTVHPDGNRSTSCVQPATAVPESFYAQRLPDLPANLPGARSLATNLSLPIVRPSMRDLGSSSKSDGGCQALSGTSSAGLSSMVLGALIACCSIARARRRQRR
jgi:hypothetical protein